MHSKYGKYTLRTLLAACLHWAQRWALAQVSKFEVGAAVLAESGVLYLGANLEFLGVPLSHTVHAEQSAIATRGAAARPRCARSRLRPRRAGSVGSSCSSCRAAAARWCSPIHQSPVALTELLPWAFGSDPARSHAAAAARRSAWARARARQRRPARHARARGCRSQQRAVLGCARGCGRAELRRSALHRCGRRVGGIQPHRSRLCRPR